MNESKISVRYAKALFLSAQENNQLDEVLKDMKLIDSTAGVNGFENYLVSPVIKTSAKKALIETVFKASVSELSMNFFYLILTNKRENYLRDIIRNFIDLYRENKGIKSANLRVPFKINEENKEKFHTLLENAFKSRVEMEEQLDPELIGGFILTVEDQQFDASVKTQLSKIKKKLLETAIEN
jgi:F-type H+-transporting ATPase subunit delta